MIREAETPFGIKNTKESEGRSSLPMGHACVCDTNKDKELAALLSQAERAATFCLRDLRGVNLIPHEFKWQYGGYYKKCFTAGVAFFGYSCAARRLLQPSLCLTTHAGARCCVSARRASGGGGGIKSDKIAANSISPSPCKE
jgi:hypothetical protein